MLTGLISAQDLATCYFAYGEHAITESTGGPREGGYEETTTGRHNSNKHFGEPENPSKMQRDQQGQG